MALRFDISRKIAVTYCEQTATARCVPLSSVDAVRVQSAVNQFTADDDNEGLVGFFADVLAAHLRDISEIDDRPVGDPATYREWPLTLLQTVFKLVLECDSPKAGSSGGSAPTPG